jgi:hypothetical protein
VDLQVVRERGMEGEGGRTSFARESASNVVLGGFEGEGAWGVDCDIFAQWTAFSYNGIGREDSAIVIAWCDVQRVIRPKNRGAGSSDKRHHQKFTPHFPRLCRFF